MDLVSSGSHGAGAAMEAADTGIVQISRLLVGSIAGAEASFGACCWLISGMWKMRDNILVFWLTVGQARAKGCYLSIFSGVHEMAGQQ